MSLLISSKNLMSDIPRGITPKELVCSLAEHRCAHSDSRLCYEFILQIIEREPVLYDAGKINLGLDITPSYSVIFFQQTPSFVTFGPNYDQLFDVGLGSLVHSHQFNIRRFNTACHPAESNVRTIEYEPNREN